MLIPTTAPDRCAMKLGWGPEEGSCGEKRSQTARPTSELTVENRRRRKQTESMRRNLLKPKAVRKNSPQTRNWCFQKILEIHLLSLQCHSQQLVDLTQNPPTVHQVHQLTHADVVTLGKTVSPAFCICNEKMFYLREQIHTYNNLN